LGYALDKPTSFGTEWYVTRITEMQEKHFVYNRIASKKVWQGKKKKKKKKKI
jgi:hypothetical protein